MDVRTTKNNAKKLQGALGNTATMLEKSKQAEEITILKQKKAEKRQERQRKRELAEATKKQNRVDEKKAWEKAREEMRKPKNRGSNDTTEKNLTENEPTVNAISIDNKLARLHAEVNQVTEALLQKTNDTQEEIIDPNKIKEQSNGLKSNAAVFKKLAPAKQQRGCFASFLSLFCRSSDKKQGEKKPLLESKHGLKK